jgi:hypothetical protein
MDVSMSAPGITPLAVCLVHVGIILIADCHYLEGLPTIWLVVWNIFYFSIDWE